MTRRRWLIAGAATALVAVAAWLVAFSPVLGVRTVAVRGAVSLSPADVRAAAAIAPGTPLIRLDTDAVRRRIDALAAVASSSVDVAYPSTVEITVVERTAVGYLRSGSGVALVDAAGVQFRTVASPPPRLPRLEWGSGDPAVAGAALATVAGALSDAERPMVTTIEVSAGTRSTATVTLDLADGRVVHWGTADRSADKARLLAAVLTQPGRTIDVSDPDVVVLH